MVEYLVKGCSTLDQFDLRTNPFAGLTPRDGPDAIARAVEARLADPASDEDRMHRAQQNLQIDSDDGETSGRIALVDGLEVRLSLRTVGEHHFRVTVFDPQRRPVPSASAELTIVRTYASARGIPATHDLAVKALRDDLSEENELLISLRKGTPLPTDRTPLRVRAARSLQHDEPRPARDCPWTPSAVSGVT
jgi:hypothetical protein